MTNGKWYILNDVNPEPWRIGPISVGRNKKTQKMFPIVGQDAQLASFQETVREVITETGEHIDGELELRFYFWRRLDSYQGKTKLIVKHEVDATNMQKATEDALQGIVMENDNLVKRILTTVVEQGIDVKPRIVIFAKPWSGLDPTEIPNEIWGRIDKTPTLIDADTSNFNSWPPNV